MFYLCSVETTDLVTVFGRQTPVESETIQPKYTNLEIIMIGQKSDSSSYLLLSNIIVDEFTKHTSIPSGYDFVFRQSWGLTITEQIIHRVIDTLRAEAYPPMAEYLDAIVKDDEAQKQKYIADCLAVKTKYPKFLWQ